MIDIQCSHVSMVYSVTEITLFEAFLEELTQKHISKETSSRARAIRVPH
jgi:hypothetical protein